jgi:pimeloyl-ACP methyl ester carboxylesterase
MMTHAVPHADPAHATCNGIDICYDTFGDPSAPPLLLVMGLGAQMIAWEEEFCAALAARDYWVVRYDNRDVGLSTRFDDAGVPDVMAMMPALMQGQAIQAPYTLRDMADDAAGLLDALGIESAYIVGVSMGGMIVQTMAIHHPQRVRTLTSIMSTTGNPELPMANPEVISLLIRPAPEDRDGYVASQVETWKVLGSPGFPFDEDLVRERAGRAFDRGLCPEGTMRQMAAILASGSRKEALKSLSVPTLVIHGDADVLVPVEGGIDTAAAVPGAKLMIVEGMGHDIPLPVAPRVIEAIAQHAV